MGAHVGTRWKAKPLPLQGGGDPHREASKGRLRAPLLLVAPAQSLELLLNRKPPRADSCSVNSANDSFSHPTAALSLHCRACSSPLIQAANWTKQNDTHWEVQLWCPECWDKQTAILNKAQAAYVSLAVEEGFACVLEAFEGLDAIPTVEPDRRK